MAFQALLILALAASASSQSFTSFGASPYASLGSAEQIQSYAASAAAPVLPSGIGSAPSAAFRYPSFNFGASPTGGYAPTAQQYSPQLLGLSSPGYDVTEPPQEPQNPPSPIPPPAAPVAFPLPQNLPLPQSLPLPQTPQLAALPKIAFPSVLQIAQPQLNPGGLSSFSSTFFSSPYASYRH